MMPRSDHPNHAAEGALPDDDAAPRKGGQPSGVPRLNLLLSCTTWRQNSALDQIPPLLSPLGILTIKAGSGEEAADVIRNFRVHIAVVDLAIPLQRLARDAGSVGQASVPASGGGRFSDEGGARILQLLRRLELPPPTVVVRSPQPATRESARSLTQALREGVFAVLDQPVHLEAMLEVMRRILRRHYSDLWPA